MSYQKPSTDLLEYHNEKTKFTDREYVKELGEKLSEILQDYKVDAVVRGCRRTPVSAMFDVIPGEKVSVKSIRNLRQELELWLESPVEIVDHGAEMFTIGVAIKNWNNAPTVGLREILESEEFQNSEYELPIAAGMDIIGRPFIFDLAAAPNLLLAGTTGSGKSVFLNDIIMSLIYNKSPEEVQFCMVDPKRVELGLYDRLPHMFEPVAFDTEDALSLMKYVDKIMEDRYQLFAAMGVRKIEDYNQKCPPENRLCRIVIIIDEYMEMMFQAPKELEDMVGHVARLARASGIHLIMATQRPSAKVVTGSIKANLPCRASFTVLDKRESKTILDRTGAERLLGNGDMLFSAADAAEPVHAQAAYVSEEEVDRVVRELATGEI